MLRHVMVVSLEQAVAAPLATRLLAADGARVIKIERAEGDFARNYDTFAKGASSYFTWLNYGKESCVVDLKKESSFMSRLLSKADVVVQNMAPGSMRKLGYDSERLRKENPRLITMDISGYGGCSARKAYDLLVTAEAGLCSITGSETGGPGRVGVSIADLMTGRVAHAAILRALLERERSGTGSSLSVSLFDVVAEMMTVPLLQYRATGNLPGRQGMKHPSIAPYGMFSSKDDMHVLLSIQNEREWVAFCELVLDNSSLAANPKFCNGVNRVSNRDELERIIDDRFRSMDLSTIIAKLQKADIAYGCLNNVHDLSIHPCLSERSVVNEHGKSVSLPIDPLMPGNLANLMVPATGQDTDRVKKEFAY